MQLRLEELQQVVKRTVKEEKSNAMIRDDLRRVLGPSVEVPGALDRVAEVANEQLDFLESTGRFPRQGAFRLSALKEAASHKSPNVRKLAARLLPERMATCMASDPSSKVRCAAANRLSYSQIKESIKRYPGDDQLRTIVRSKKLHEAGVPNPKPADEPFDMYGEEPLGDAVKTRTGMDVPDTWYDRTARKLCGEYGNNLEGQWEEVLATRVVASHYSTTGVKLDREKLLKAIYDCIKEREDAVIGEGSLKSLAARLLKESYLDEATMPIIEENHDPIADLLESDSSTSEYVSRAEDLFAVKKSTIPAGIKKYRMGEGLHETQIPVKGRIPGLGQVTPTVEKALDRYVDSWNKQQAMSGEPYKLSWGPNGAGVDLIGFNLELK